MKQVSSFADRLREYIAQHEGMTYERLSKLTGEKPQTLNRYALGQRIPKIDSAVRIAMKLGVHPLWLQGFDEPSSPKDSPALSINTAASSEERELMGNFVHLNLEGRRKLLDYSEDLVSCGRYAAQDEDAE